MNYTRISNTAGRASQKQLLLSFAIRIVDWSGGDIQYMLRYQPVMTDELQLPPGLQIRLLTSEESALLAEALSSEDTGTESELSDGQVKDNPVSLEVSNSLPPKSSFPASLCSILKFLTPSPYILSVLQTSLFPLSFLLLTTPCASRKMKRMTDKDKLQEEGRRSRSRERGGGT